MPICGAVGCSNRPGVNRDVRYHKTPQIIDNQGDEARILSEQRRRLWKKALNRKDITTEERWDRTIVCSRHFVNGEKAYLHSNSSPSWVPSLNLGSLQLTFEWDREAFKARVTRCLPWTSLHQPQYEQMSEGDLRKVASEVFRKMKISEEQAVAIEQVTRQRSKRSAWYRQRAGLVTCATVKALINTSVLKPCRSLIHKICYPESCQLGAAEEEDTRWGCRHQKSAMKLYSFIQGASHTDFRTRECGFFVWKENPHMGASPDAIVRCRCCGLGCLEIKCCHCRKPKSWSAVERDHPYCLGGADDLANISLKQDSAYYFQVQAQILITQSHYCDFVVMNGGAISVRRIKYDRDFLNAVVDTVNILYRHLILPELLGKLYSRSGAAGELSGSASSDHAN
ncbi:uncharacterized protein LOC133497619 [Syngnathoides biaculeatus]|uniref:uncharacterized protein LOC133497619 n=1 Tax=Syngnathoides biaculeatus TaxID=300417 RepID=UPI002ADDAABD|nr:uncharacterized protein LOC133497619 [Syngnathoides biaculeatus]